MLKEKDIYDIIRYYPYLVDDQLKNLKLENRIYPDGTKPDFVFSSEKISIIIEVKKDIIDRSAVNQIYSYINKEKELKGIDNVRGILIGQYLSEQAQRLIDKLNCITVKILEKDVPLKIKICARCRLANSYYIQTCKYCGSKDFFE